MREGPWYRRLSWRFALITAVFVYTTVANEVEKGFQGFIISLFFIVTILVTSFWSRWPRSRELRFAGFKMPDPESQLPVGHDPRPGTDGPGAAPTRPAEPREQGGGRSAASTASRAT